MLAGHIGMNSNFNVSKSGRDHKSWPPLESTRDFANQKTSLTKIQNLSISHLCYSYYYCTSYLLEYSSTCLTCCSTTSTTCITFFLNSYIKLTNYTKVQLFQNEFRTKHLLSFVLPDLGCCYGCQGRRTENWQASAYSPCPYQRPETSCRRGESTIKRIRCSR